MPRSLEALGWNADWAAELRATRRRQSDSGPHRRAAPRRVRRLVRGRASCVHGGRPLVLRARGRRASACRRRLGRRRTTRRRRHRPSTAILERRSAFIRKQPASNSTEQVLAANVDAAFLLAGLDDDFSLRRLERYIATAWESGAEPIDRADESRPLPGRRRGRVRGRDGRDRRACHPDLERHGRRARRRSKPIVRPGRTVVLLGSSGVGKSTLLNRLAGTELMRTAALAADGTGRHTTTHRELVRSPRRAHS